MKLFKNWNFSIFEKFLLRIEKFFYSKFWKIFIFEKFLFLKNFNSELKIFSIQNWKNFHSWKISVKNWKISILEKFQFKIEKFPFLKNFNSELKNFDSECRNINSLNSVEFILLHWIHLHQFELLNYTFPAVVVVAVRIRIKAKQGQFALVWLGYWP